MQKTAKKKEKEKNMPIAWRHRQMAGRHRKRAGIMA